ncbi:hypothetical protein [Oceanobacillus neutriphilus]|uniref:DUF4271 domain-containing protein n=1 Tax=Oceanobacillus neutriphilus TaxID=531815 RepID=A0ABQ2P1E3_9BACI|nr:hypothetical protein [Oceanobacillus neutriphilus]GGP15612.1 hypothetical protein GCM10011346_44370 [Oceanobacillus neutriphilus]
MEKDDKKQEENAEEKNTQPAPNEEKVNEETGQTEIPDQYAPGQAETNNIQADQSQQGEAQASATAAEQPKKEKSSQFDFQESFNETKEIALGAILRPSALIHSSRAIKVETSVIIFALLAILVSVCHYLFYKYGFDGALSFLSNINFTFFLKTFVSWILTFAIGYFSLYILLKHFGNRTMEHKDLLTKYAIVNVPYVLVFCLVTLFIGLVLVDLFMVTYVFSLLLFGFIHVYLFLALMEKSRFDIFWTLAVYQLVLIVASYYLVGVEL